MACAANALLKEEAPNLVFKDDSHFSDFGGKPKANLSPRTMVAMNSFRPEPEPEDEPDAGFADHGDFGSTLFQYSAEKRIKVKKDLVFLPPTSELEAVGRYCDDLQQKALQLLIAKAKESHEKALPMLRNRVLNLSVDGKKWTEADLKKLLLWIRDEAPIIIHVPLDADGRLDKLLSDTHYRNQFETRMSRGTLDFKVGGSRYGWEKRIFSDAYNDAAPFQRPKYGCLNIVNDPRGIQCATSYGDCYLILKHCRLRTSFADMDSSSSSCRIASCEYHAHVLTQYNDNELSRVLEVATRKRLWHRSDVIHTYKEVQIHGEIRLNENIDLVVVNQRFKSNKEFLHKVEKFCEKNNCRYVIMQTHSEAEDTKFEGDLWGQVGTEKPEGFLCKEYKLPGFLRTESDALPSDVEHSSFRTYTSSPPPSSARPPSAVSAEKASASFELPDLFADPPAGSGGVAKKAFSPPPSFELPDLFGDSLPAEVVRTAPRPSPSPLASDSFELPDLFADRLFELPDAFVEDDRHPSTPSSSATSDCSGSSFDLPRLFSDNDGEPAKDTCPSSVTEKEEEPAKKRTGVWSEEVYEPSPNYPAFHRILPCHYTQDEEIVPDEYLKMVATLKKTEQHSEEAGLLQIIAQLEVIQEAAKAKVATLQASLCGVARSNYTSYLSRSA